MQAIAPRIPWSSVAVFALVTTALLGILRGLGFGWPMQVAAVALVLLGWVTWIRRGRA
jgi:hypothetical protein